MAGTCTITLLPHYRHYLHYLHYIPVQSNGITIVREPSSARKISVIYDSFFELQVIRSVRDKSFQIRVVDEEILTFCVVVFGRQSQSCTHGEHRTSTRNSAQNNQHKDFSATLFISLSLYPLGRMDHLLRTVAVLQLLNSKCIPVLLYGLEAPVHY